MEEGSAMYITSKAFKDGSRIRRSTRKMGRAPRATCRRHWSGTTCRRRLSAWRSSWRTPSPRWRTAPPASPTGLPENFATKEHDDEYDELTQIREGINDFKIPSYRGSNPPVGVHNYEFHLYALDDFPKGPKKPNKDRLLEAMEGHILEEAMLVGHYNKDHPTGQPQHS